MRCERVRVEKILIFNDMTNAEFNEQFRRRTQQFAVRTLKFIESLPFNTATRIMTYQFGKSGTSVGANFRAFCRGRSKNEKYSKICIVVEEADECIYWLELFVDTGYGDGFLPKVLKF